MNGAIEKCIERLAAMPERFEDGPFTTDAARAELAALREEIARMRDAILSALPELEQYAADVGGCDHSVGICVCGLEAAIRKAKAALGAIYPA